LHFTRLRLLGFKSFVDPTELVIAPGLTGVVGPNGCGKSNLLEALRWVMGESRPSVMRGDGMEDVIFAGSGARPARNHAEVTLTLDNRERRAPSGFNEDDSLEIIRRITRDAGSAYKANGREARARDVQMLFADASTGSHSPSLVRQGQIAELINAKPKSRRRILEEAAGISGLYQRRHEAELKLRATETNLGRVGDVLEALQSQLNTLARQAGQARRYREIAEALRRAEALLLVRTWRDAEVERAAASAALTAAARAAGAATTEAAAAATARAAAEERLPARREEDAVAGAILQKLTIERDRIAAEAQEVARRIAELDGQLRQIAADREREAALDGDAVAMTGRLATERAELEAEGEGAPEASAAARAAADEAAEALKGAEAGFDARAEAAARLSAEHAAAQRLLADARRRHEDLTGALRGAEAALGSAEREHRTAVETRARAAAEAEETARAAAEAEARLGAAEEASGTARSRAEATRGALSEAEGAAKALAAEAAGLERMLRRPDSSGAQVLDDLTVEPGFETALGAALADDLSLPLADGDGTGWRELAAYEASAPLPEGAEPLAAKVRGPAALARRLGAVGIVARSDGARLQAGLAQGQRLVSVEGDLWRWDGMAVAAGDAPSAAAERLRQRNRLAEVSAARDAAEAELASVRAARDAAAGEQQDAAEAERAARAARKAAEQAAADAARARSRAESAAEALEARLSGMRAGRARRSEEIVKAETELAAAERAGAGLADPAEARAAVEAERMRVEAARLTMLTRRAEAQELERADAARARRLAEIGRELESWTARRANAGERLAGLDRRAAQTEADLEAARARPADLEARQAELGAAIGEAETRRRRAADALAEAETALREADAAARAAERAAGDAREARARAEAQGEAAEVRAAAETDRLRSETDREPADLVASLEIDLEALPPAQDIEAEVIRLRRSRDGLGSVNLRAEEDAVEIRAEFDGLTVEAADLQEAVNKLRHGIANLNREGRTRLLAAFEEVNVNFSALFKHLFGGGEANLVLVESDDPLEAGLEIMCQPPGKKLSTLSLLSGGEQTLTAMSLIFAVFLANPSPICVLDEVDAPLDDANVGRFCDLLDEMTERTNTRFLIITHHAVTMSRMDRLFGVTMAEQGVSQLVSVDLEGAERIVENA
jgi:chromosome segregation protein